MLVSCIMPTYNRRTFIGAAIDCWLKQTYEDRELVIVDDGDDKVKDLIPIDPRVRYIEISRVSTGQKRNVCCEEARGEVICHFDDDDFSAPDRIAAQVKQLEDSGKPVTGYSTLLFWDVLARQAKIYRAQVKGYICGTTFCYLKSFWQVHPFRDKQEGSDNDFIYPVLSQVQASNDYSHMVARIHDCHHTSRKGGIVQIVPTSAIPDAFWENERLRQQCTPCN
jgi:glycosyltransferase involved in cell wall biosynthesis